MPDIRLVFLIFFGFGQNFLLVRQLLLAPNSFRGVACVLPYQISRIIVVRVVAHLHQTASGGQRLRVVPSRIFSFLLFP